jgi:membrane protease subunit HflC
LLIAIFAIMLFTFQVRQTEVALVTTFGKPSRDITEPGLYFKLPWPIQDKQIYDSRVQNFEDKLEETYTKDRFTLDVMVYAGWTISNPTKFRETFGGSIQRAENDLDGLIRSAKMAVVGQHPFSHFISTDEKELQLGKIEDEILARVQDTARNNYGITVKPLGIKMLRLPDRVTKSVFDRMKEERNRFVQQLEGEGYSEALKIHSAADTDRDKILAAADAQANRIRSEAESEAAKYYSVLEKNPELATFLLKLKALEAALKDRSTLILDPRSSPFDLLNSTGGTTPAKGNLR